MEHRDIVKRQFADVCAGYPAWLNLPLETRDTYIRRMERCCYNNAVLSCDAEGIYRSFQYTNGAFVARYQTNCYRVLSNLDPTGVVGSSYLIERLCAGSVDPEKILDLTSYEMYPEASREIRAEIALRKQQKVDQKVSERYTCSKCNHNKTVLLEYAPRAADEATVTSIRCINCDHVWRRG